MQLEQGNVVVEGLAVVVVVDVGGGHPQGLGSRTSKLLGQVVVTHAHVDGVSCPHNAETKHCVMVSSFSSSLRLTHFHICIYHIYVSDVYSLGDAVCSCENPGLSYEGSSAEVLVEAVDQGNLLMMMIVMIMMMMMMLMLMLMMMRATCQHHSPGAASSPPTTRPLRY